MVQLSGIINKGNERNITDKQVVSITSKNIVTSEISLRRITYN